MECDEMISKEESRGRRVAVLEQLLLPPLLFLPP